MVNVPMKSSIATRTRRFAVATALATVAAAVLVSFGGAGSAATGAPTLYILYTMNCTFTIQNDAGQTITSIAPGTYQVDVRTPVQFGTLPLPASATDMTACRGFPQFQLTGPGVSLQTTLTAGCQDDVLFPETFQPSATYTAEDLNQPSVAHASFTTLASGTPTIPNVTYGGGKGHAETSQDIVGSANVKGTLNALVNAKGTLTLTTKQGKPVSKLDGGRYRFAVTDDSKKLGVSLLGPTSTKPIVLTTSAFHGKHSVTLRLTTGRWAYYTNLHTIRYFRVA